MKYKVRFPSHSIEKKFDISLSRILPVNIQDRVMLEIEELANNPRPFDKKLFKQLKPPIQVYRFSAQYRLRIGDYRVLYDVDDKRKIVWILTLRKRSEKTYKY